MNTLVKFTLKRVPMLKANCDQVHFSERPRGWRNSFSIQRASERNVCEQAILPLLSQTLICPLLSQPQTYTYTLLRSQPSRQKLRGQLHSEHFSEVHATASADAEGQLRPGSLP
ncbi:hypothetical protein [Desulfosporosinus sp. HMP52]|uniref:hypothetical protein n=1 Tax=Desulfosporosinus sp. HMP52 TaxID=1487923 RepID=UPI000FFEE815|nr:hypothetical protein [Desulfosporosinus sp. HMP52]